MARIAPTSRQKLSFLIFILIGSFILYIDITTNSFQNVKNGFKALKISTYFLTREYTIEPIKFFIKFSKNKNDLINENENLKKALDLSYLNNYLISNENIFYKDKEIIKTYADYKFSSSYNIAKLKNIDPNMYKCCDRHRMILEIIESNNYDFIESVVFNDQGIVGHIIDENIFFEVLLLTDTSHSLPIKSEPNSFFCNAKGSGNAEHIQCSYSPLIWTEEIKINQTFYTSGLGGVYPKDIKIGHVSKIKKIDSNENVIEIKLITNPFRSDLFGVLRN